MDAFIARGVLSAPGLFVFFLVGGLMLIVVLAMYSVAMLRSLDAEG